MAMTKFEKTVNTRLIRTKKSAESRNKEFNLTFEYMKNILLQTHCAYSGEPFKPGKGPDMMTLERWDCDKGYVIGNVIPVKQKYNNLRGNLSFEQLCGSAYSKAQDVASLDRPETLKGKVKSHYETIQRIRKNQEGRKKKVETLMEKVILDNGEQVVLNACIKRLESSEKEIAILEACMEKELRKEKSNLRNQVITKTSAAHGYGIIAQGLLKYLNATPAQMENLMKGLPIDSEEKCTTDTHCITKTETDLNSQSSTKTLCQKTKSSLCHRIVLWLKNSWKTTKIILKDCFTQNQLQ